MELLVEESRQLCTCNAIKANLFTLQFDMTRVEGPLIEFPIIEKPVEEERYNIQVQTVYPYDLSADTKAVYVWISESVLIAMLSLIGVIVAARLDDTDQKEISIGKTVPVLTALTKNNHFISEVAKQLDEPYSSVVHREQQIKHYRSVSSKAVYPHVVNALHPLVAPFTGYSATESRSLRFCSYLALFNAVSLVNVAYFSNVYRRNDDSVPYNDVLDS